MQTLSKLCMLSLPLALILILPKPTFLQPSFEGIYLMDGNPNRRIIASFITDGVYKVEEQTSPWPWSGAAILAGDKIFGLVRFRDNLTTMMLNGTMRSDGFIVIAYVFLTDRYGNLLNNIGPGQGRIDNHIWKRE